MTQPDRESRVITVRLFAAARDRAGSDSVNVELPAGATIGDLRSVLGVSVPTLHAVSRHLLFAVGTEYATDASAVPESDEVVAFPPVSGG